MEEVIVKDFFIHVFVGFCVSVGFIIISAIIQHTWRWIDDNEKDFDNYFGSLTLRARGYHLHTDNKYYLIGHIEESFYTKNMADAFVTIVFLGMGSGVIVWIYEYYFIVAIVIMVLIGVLFLTRYIRRLHKKLDAHLVNHK